MAHLDSVFNCCSVALYRLGDSRMGKKMIHLQVRIKGINENGKIIGEVRSKDGKVYFKIETETGRTYTVPFNGLEAIQ